MCMTEEIVSVLVVEKGYKKRPACPEILIDVGRNYSVDEIAELVALLREPNAIGVATANWTYDLVFPFKWKRIEQEVTPTFTGKITNPDPLQLQVGGNHYKDFKIQPIEFSMANNLNPCQHNVIKYILREKGSIEDRLQDLEKAKHYIDLLASFIKTQAEAQTEKGNTNV